MSSGVGVGEEGGRRTRLIDTSFRVVSAGVCWSLVGLVLLGCLFILWRGLTGSSVGLEEAVLDSHVLVGIALGFAAPLGIVTAIWAEARPRNPGLRRFVDIDLGVLESVPPFVFGLAAVVLLSHGLELGQGVLVGGLAVGAMLLPAVIAGARVAIAEVSWSELEAGYALGGSRARLLAHLVLPSAAPRLGAVACRGAARAFGSAAPLLMLMWLVDPNPGHGVEGVLAVSVFEDLAARQPVGASVLVLLVVAGGLELLARVIEPQPSQEGERGR